MAQPDITTYYFYAPYFALMGDESREGRQYFLEKYDDLSQEIKYFLVSEEVAQEVMRIGNSLELTREQKEVISVIIRNIVSGLDSQENLRSLLTDHIGLPSEYVENIASEIENRVLPLIGKVGEPAPEQVALPPVIPGQQVNPNNIIDLRQQNK